MSALHPAEHRGLRELHAMARQMAAHWGKLAERLGPGPEPALRAGADTARELLEELDERTAAYGLQGRPTAQGVGNRAAGLRVFADALLERHQALRTAALDAVHVGALLGFLAAVADSRGDAALAAWHRRWQTRLREAEDAARDAAAELGRDPDAAIEPAEPGRLGRAGHSLAVGFGTVGEAIDGSALGRAARRRGGR